MLPAFSRAASNCVAEAMDVISVALQGDRLGDVDASRLVAWNRAIRDSLRDVCRRAHHDKKRAFAKAKLRSIRRRASRRKGVAAAPAKGGSRSAPSPPLCRDPHVLARSLDEAVGARPVKQLEQDDLHTVEQLGRAVSAALCSGLDDSLRVDEVPGVMTRCSLYEGEHLVVRLHLFPDMAETSIHNHQNNFASVCLYGSYTHTIWTVSSETDKMHYVCCRGADGQLSAPQKKPGGLVPGHTHVTSTNKAYYLCKETHHTVKAGGEAPRNGTLTLYVKGRESAGTGFATRILSQDGKFDEGLSVPDVPLEGEAKRAVLRQMSAMLWLAAPEQLSKRC